MYLKKKKTLSKPKMQPPDGHDGWMDMYMRACVCTFKLTASVMFNCTKEDTAVKRNKPNFPTHYDYLTLFWNYSLIQQEKKNMEQQE